MFDVVLIVSEAHNDNNLPPNWVPIGQLKCENCWSVKYGDCSNHSIDARGKNYKNLLYFKQLILVNDIYNTFSLNCISIKFRIAEIAV